MPAQGRSARSTIIARRLAPRRGDVAAFIGGVLVPLGIFAALGVTVAGNGAQSWEAAPLDLTERYYRGSAGVGSTRRSWRAGRWPP